MAAVLERRRWLLGAVGVLLSGGFIVVWIRLVQLQLLQAPELQYAAQQQGYVRLQLLPTRGAIVDCRGEVLAVSVEAPSYGVDPVLVRCPDCLCRQAAAALGIAQEECRRLLSTARGRFLWLRRAVWGRPTEALDTLNEPGLVRIRERVRVYIPEDLFVPVLGGVGIDQQGLSGLELAYDSLLRRELPPVLMRRDARGRLFPTVEYALRPPEEAPTLQTTLDGALQHILAYEVAEGVRQSEAVAGIGIALEPATGALRAGVVVPTPPRASAHAPLVGQVYEPGSVLKPLVAAIALEAGAIGLEDTLDGHGGWWQIGEHRIVDAQPLGRVTLRQALAFSSNVVFAELATRLPPTVLTHYLHRFGFGMPPGSGLPGEAAGIVPQLRASELERAAFWGFGYGIAVSPLQLACAYGALANDGVLVPPRLVEAVYEAKQVRVVPPQPGRRVVSAATARRVRQLLVSVVEEGTGRAARVAGLSIAGKTGTAQQLVEGRYSRQAHTASFVAMVPAERPRLVLLVMVVRPQRGSTGGEVAAPIVRRVLQRMGAHPVLSAYIAPGTASGERSS